MFSPNRYAAVHQLDLRSYYNDSGHQPLSCELCRSSRNTPSPLKEFPLAAPERAWYYCPRCSFSGTALDYLAKLEGKHPLEILDRLLKTGTVPSIGEETIRSYRAYCDASKTLREDLHELRSFDRTKSFRLAPLHELDDYFHAAKYRMGDRDEIERIFHRNSGRYNTSGSRLFRGRNWRDITVIPLYDMPLRMSALLFVNGHRNGSPGLSIKRLGPRQSGLYLFEPGYLATSEIAASDPASDYIVLSSDWFRVLQIQASFYRHNKRIAPIVGWFPSDPRTEKPYFYKWTFFNKTKKIFWADREDMPSLREACLQRSMVSNAYYAAARREEFRTDAVESPMILNSIAKDARSWQDALTLYLQAEPDRIEARLSLLQLPQKVLEEYLADLPDLQLARIIRERFFTGETTVCRVNNIVVIGSREGWSKQARTRNEVPELLSSVRCLIDRAVRIGENEPLYEGRVLIGDEIHSFVEAESVLEKNTIDFVRNVCNKNHSKHIPAIYVSDKMMFQMIRAHAKNEVVQFQSGFGWDDRAAALVLPNMTISDGNVFLAQRHIRFGPFSSLMPEHARPLTQNDLHDLASFKEETPYILALLVALLPPLFAAAYKAIAPQTVVLDYNLDSVQKVFELLQLPVALQSVPKTVAEYRQVHRCPYLIQCGTRRVPGVAKDLATWRAKAGMDGCSFVGAARGIALARLSYGFANVFFPPRSRYYRWLQGDFPAAYQKCFVALLRYFSRYVLDRKILSENWNSNMIHEALQVLESQGLPVHKNSLFDAYYDPSSYFCDYINHLQQSEELTVTQTEEGLSIPVGKLAECFYRHLDWWDFEGIKAMLSENMILKRYDLEKNIFIVEAEPFQISVKRFERLYQYPTG